MTNREIAERIVNDLFTNGASQEAERLVLELPADAYINTYGGGWCRDAVRDVIVRHLEAIG